MLRVSKACVVSSNRRPYASTSRMARLRLRKMMRKCWLSAVRRAW
ncbi:MAG: hypothetical protein IIW59_03320 [Alistipes sp.]|nr:hypothetical protein [Alistipes sp.]